MKRVLSAVVSALLVVAMSVCSFALTSDGYYEFPTASMFYQDGGNSYIGTLKTSMLSDTQKDFMRDWFLESDRNICSYYPKYDVVLFVTLPDGYEDKGKMVIYDNFVCLKNISANSVTNFSVVAFDATTGEPVKYPHASTSALVCTMIGVSSYPLGYVISSTYFNDVGFPFGNEYLVDYSGHLYFVDDDGLLEGDEPPASSSEPETSEPAFEFPEIQPTDNPYIAYDVTIWNRAANVIKQSAGNSINISWLILAMVMGWLLVSRIVKKLSK